jgi:hypothetical protein
VLERSGANPLAGASFADAILPISFKPFLTVAQNKLEYLSFKMILDKSNMHE